MPPASPFTAMVQPQSNLAYGVNEVIGPEWIGVTSKHRPGPNPTIKYVDTGSDKRQRPLSTPAPTPTSPSTPSTPVAHMAPSKVVVYKMPVAQMTGLNARMGKLPVAITAQTPAASRSRLQAATQSVLVNGGLSTAMHINKPIQLLLDPPYVNEPDFTAASRTPDGSETNPKSALQAFYTANTFECGYHTTITKFLLQLDTEKLKCLQPGSVRLTTKLAHMGFVHRALQDFNQRSVDGLLPSVVVVPITVEGEKQDVWISWTDVDGYDGLAGGWRAGKGKVVKRKRRA
ncbi:hypothetical protein SMMN14_07059 [Sphaerulina musiva]